MGRRKQTSIPGTEPKTIPEVSEAAEAYREARDTRMAMTDQEVSAHDKLLAVMEQHKLEHYKDADASPPFEVKLKIGKKKVKVKSLGAPDDEDEE